MAGTYCFPKFWIYKLSEFFEICYWRFSLFEANTTACYDDHIDGKISFAWWCLKSLEDCSIKSAKQSYWWRFGDKFPSTIKHVDMLFSPCYYELKDFDVLSAQIWLEFETHCPQTRMLQKCWWYFPSTSFKLATWICEGFVWSILLEHSSGFKFVSHLLNFGYWSCKFWQLSYYEISYKDNGDIVLNPHVWWVSLLLSQSNWIWFKEILVVPKILRSWYGHWFFQKLRWSMACLKVCTSKDIVGVERVLDTEGYQHTFLVQEC